MNKVTYKKLKVELIRDENNICFSEIQREGFSEGQIIEGDLEIINGKESKRVYFGECVVFLGVTAKLVDESKELTK